MFISVERREFNTQIEAKSLLFYDRHGQQRKKI